VGVTHATLLRHFSTKDALLIAVVDKIRIDLQRAVVSDPEFVAAKSLSELVSAVWQRLCDPKEQRQFALLFDIVQDRSRVDSDDNTSRAIVNDWIELIADSLHRFGHGDSRTAVATLLLAQFRGLQLDLLLTGDRGRVDAALDALLRVLDPAS
jgi:AcrR family transcriptional regulator